MRKEFRKAKTNHIDGNYEFIIDCGDLYFRENVSFEDDENIRNTLNNSKWEDSTFLEPLEDKDDFEQLNKLKKLVGEDVEITFETLDEKNEELMIKEGIGKNKKW